MLAHRVARERDEARFETRLVAVRRVHVAELVVRGDGAAAGADRDERAVVALLPRRQPLEVAQRRLRYSSCRPSMWPVDCSASPANPGHAKSDPSGPMV